MKRKYSMWCSSCGDKVSLNHTCRCPRCGNSLDITYDYEYIRRAMRKGLPERPDMWRYEEMLPAEFDQSLSLGEGGTALIKSVSLGPKWGIPNLHFKCENQNPTGSFKDRQIVVAIAVGKQQDKHGCVTSSSGNAGAALATYAARTAMPSMVLVPSGTPRAGWCSNGSRS